MNPEIQGYVNDLYSRALGEARRARQEEVVSLKKEILKRGLHQGLSGVEVGGMINIEVEFIGRRMMARLDSFREAFGHARATPSAEEFEEIWREIEEVQKMGLNSSARHLREYVKRCGGSYESTAGLSEATARHHDRVLEEWKVWRSGSRLAASKPEALQAQVAGGGLYEFHQEIEIVSGQLYRDGYFREAMLNAFIRIISEVRDRSGLVDKDGDQLMNHAFGSDKNDPRICFNSLSNQAEHDEQRGLMFVFKGVVAMRNFKAHTNVLFDSPERAHEYLGLASLLMRLLDIAETKE